MMLISTILTYNILITPIGWKTEKIITEKFQSMTSCMRDVENRIQMIKSFRDENPDVTHQNISEWRDDGYTNYRFYEATIDNGLFSKNIYTKTLWVCQKDGSLYQEVTNFE